MAAKLWRVRHAGIVIGSGDAGVGAGIRGNVAAGGRGLVVALAHRTDNMARDAYLLFTPNRTAFSSTGHRRRVRDLECRYHDGQCSASYAR